MIICFLAVIYIPVLSGGRWYVLHELVHFPPAQLAWTISFSSQCIWPMHRDAQIHRGILRHKQSNFYFHSFHYSLYSWSKSWIWVFIERPKQTAWSLCNSLNFISKSTYLRSLLSYSWVMMAPVKPLDLPLNDTSYCFHLASSKKSTRILERVNAV